MAPSLSSKRKVKDACTNKDAAAEPAASAGRSKNVASSASTSSPTHPVVILLSWYLLFGLLHEVAHMVSYYVLIWLTSWTGDELSSERVQGDDSELLVSFVNILKLTLGRCAVLPLPTTTTVDGYEDIDLLRRQRWILDAVRHAGWLVSVLLALSVHAMYVYSRRRNGHGYGSTKRACFPSPTALASCCLAAYITAFEAVSTDLLGLVPAWAAAGAASSPGTGTANVAVFFCGNFGILLINTSWVKVDGGKTALDVLEKMVNVTMMRGAQCGGVVTFVQKQKGGAMRGDNDTQRSSTTCPEGIRCRTVNAKRTDLSKRVRTKIERDACRNGRLIGSDEVVHGLYGHTRFATTSKATFDGCHPHQWTPASKRRVYHPFVPMNSANRERAAGASPVVVREVYVDNYITHNGDLDFFLVRGKSYDLGTIQSWLEVATETPMPTTVDSAAIAGLVDLIRTQGCFGLSARFAVSFGLSTSRMMEPDPMNPLPTYKEYERIGMVFEEALDNALNEKNESATATTTTITLDDISSNPERRQDFKVEALKRLRAEYANELDGLAPNDASGGTKPDPSSSTTHHRGPYHALSQFIGDEESGASLAAFASATVDAFFDNDLLQTTRFILANAKGSFGLCVASSLDAHRQVCLAARGQTMSIAFYPRKGLICYGSEQAAVKAGVSFDTPGGDLAEVSGGHKANETLRLDLDDLGGEICLLDWGWSVSPVEEEGGGKVPQQAPPPHAISPPNRHLQVHQVMGGTVQVTLLHESKVVAAKDRKLWARMTLLEGNELVKPLTTETRDLILSDIQDIPSVCATIQDDWRAVGLNRLTAWHLQQCVQKRMQGIVDGRVSRHAGSIDILLTGCEVSLWLAEQFACDLQKSFPKLFIKPVSSNKLLGLFGQDLSVPCVGYPMSEKTHEMDEVIVIIVSHSGGTFAPLACSNLLQSITRNIFVVSSEWDTQIGKQLRSIHDDNELISSRIFSTDVGVRPAEPCSLSVAATQQLLTNIFEHICLTIISNLHFRHASGAIITEYDLQVLERCNNENIAALEAIVGMDPSGVKVDSKTELELRAAGDVWSEHILENAKAYIMSFIYIVVTVTIGYPLISGLADAFGLQTEWAFYITRFFDSLIYFFLPQINIFIIRLFQGRNLRHRMVGRTVVIGDCPWVAQAAEAFLSKIFACSYSVAGLNVLSGNPADHLVHRHTHRVVRGSLLVCGRPDGRLSALTSLEATVCLSVNQASSIQSLGGTCESVTIGHNPFRLPLTAQAIVLKPHRPAFLCETVLRTINETEDEAKTKSLMENEPMRSLEKRGSLKRLISASRNTVFTKSGRSLDVNDELTASRSNHGRLLGIYTDLQNTAGQDPLKHEESRSHTVDEIVKDMIREKAGFQKLRRIFDEIDSDGNGTLDEDEFIEAFKKCDPSLSEDAVRKMFKETDVDESGALDFEEFLTVAKMPQANMVGVLQSKNRSERGLLIVEPSRETHFGQDVRKNSPANVTSFSLVKSQHFAMELYESRIASLQRFVAMTVMFHQMGYRVQSFFSHLSLGLLGYRMDRTHSIMRIATTASPVSGADVRERMEVLRLVKAINQSVAIISRTWAKYKKGGNEKQTQR